MVRATQVHDVSGFLRTAVVSGFTCVVDVSGFTRTADVSGFTCVVNVSGFTRNADVMCQASHMFLMYQASLALLMSRVRLHARF